MKTLTTFCLVSLISTAALADYNLAMNGKTVECYGDDNVSITLNAKRTWITYTVEGEAVKYKITDKDTDGDTRVTYYAAETDSQGPFVLSLDDQGDAYSFAENDELAGIECK